MQTPAIDLELALVEPMLDLAVLTFTNEQLKSPLPRFIDNPLRVKVGEEVLVVGYPFANIGSFLETTHVAHISAIGNRLLMGQVGRLELILSTVTHPGSSGSPVIRRADGIVCGVIRGTLAPPSGLSIGNLPLGTDTSVTYAASAHVIPALVEEAFDTNLLT